MRLLLLTHSVIGAIDDQNSYFDQTADSSHGVKLMMTRLGKC